MILLTRNTAMVLIDIILQQLSFLCSLNNCQHDFGSKKIALYD